MNKYIIAGCLLLIGFLSIGQIVTISPSDATGDDELTITFDATLGTGGLAGTSSVYMHSGVVTDSPNGTDWNYVVGNWGQDDGLGKMTLVDGETDKWELTITPRNYYSVPEGTNIFRLSMVFRSADGSSEGKGTSGDFDGGTVASNGDIFLDLSVEAFVNITSPFADQLFLVADNPFEIAAEASAEVTSMSIAINNTEVASVDEGTSITYNYVPQQSETINISVDAVINGISVNASKEVIISIRPAAAVVALPAGIKKGINYSDDASSVTLVLEAPNKDFVYVVGDFTNWEVADNYLMNQTPDGELYWLEVTGLTADQSYVFQYWVNGTVKVGDPYADQVSDPWNDQYISTDLYPNLPLYDKTENGVASVIRTGQTPYSWSEAEDTWTAPLKDDLIIYELLVRDFVGSHSYQDVIDSLQYLKGLGINAIELMPVMEFEGNSSWGYNVSYFFAPDKYYGAKDDLKSLVDAAHEQGIAVIMDMVLNHAFGQNAMVKMYWDETTNNVSEGSPWFNTVATHPYNVGYDFNHESSYTKAFVDSVNTYWMQEYHIDGFRFDLSKGFTQVNSGDDVSAWGQYDASRIAILERMANAIWDHNENAYVILEHFAEDAEENELASSGMLLWRNLNHNYANALDGSGGDLSGGQSRQRVAYMESHDEERLAYVMKSEGVSSGSYHIANQHVFLERAKMAAAFHLLQSGPKMIWQFGELGYDININYNERTGEKPLVWGENSLGYYEDEFRQYVYDAYAAILDLRNQYPVVVRAGSYSSNINGDLKQISITHPTLDITIIGNFGVNQGEVNPSFAETGSWFDYFSGEEINVTNVSDGIILKPGEFHIYTSEQVSEGFDDVVKVYENPVSVDPSVFTSKNVITITFDASLASTAGTNGLVGAETVYMHAGIVSDSPDATELTHIIGSLTDDGVGEMTKVAGETDQWSITLTPYDYFELTDTDDAFRIGMYFRDADNTNQAKGFRDQIIYLDILQEGNIVSVSPADFSVEDEITITFNSALGNRGLIDATKIYMHSGVVTSNVDTPSGDDWSNIIGNWAADDGVGEMTKVSGTDLWEITLSPQQYYDLAGDAFWLTMVFRDATGANKGTGPESEFDGGFIADNGDIYVSIPSRPMVLEAEVAKSIGVYPNPSNGIITISAGIRQQIKVYNQVGGLVMDGFTDSEGKLDCSNLPNGIYVLRTGQNYDQSTKLIIRK